MPFRQSSGANCSVKAVLGPTNTGKTHLAIERLCAHSSGAIGFPLRLLAREVYDRVCAIKGANRVALITGEERIEPQDARWFLCTMEAMPVGRDFAFVGLDEAQLAADRDRGHIFTDRLLHARGRDETMILGSASLEPMVRALVPGVEVVSRPRFSTLSHAGALKLSRIPPRSTIVAFSAEQVYAIAEMLRRFRGGAAVVMGALSPQTRNAQVALYQSGEVDYLVATDAIGMGLNLDVNYVAFAGLSKFDGIRQRRLTPAEMAQIAGRAGRHQRDGTFGSLAGTGTHDATFTDEEIFAIEEHRFPPLNKLFWREAEPRFDNVQRLVDDLETPPDRAELAPAPEAIDLGVLKRLADIPEIAQALRGKSMVRRFWEVCQLPDFRQHGTDTHARFVARLWQDLRHGQLGTDYVAQAIAALDNVSGDIDTLQGRIAAIRSWAYIAQRPDWVMGKEEMAARARAAEARLSDALHARLTERFINRRTAILMKKLGPDAALLPVTIQGDTVLVDGEHLGELSAFRFHVDPQTRHADQKLLLAAAEKHLPEILAERADSLTDVIAAGEAPLTWEGDALLWGGSTIARLAPTRALLEPKLVPDTTLNAVPANQRQRLILALNAWLKGQLGVLEPLRQLDEASTSADAGPELRALLIRLVETGGMLERTESGIESLDKLQRSKLAKLGVRVGALDIFVPAMLRPTPLSVWLGLTALGDENRTAPQPDAEMPPTLAAIRTAPPPGYRRLSKQWLRLDMAEKLLRQAHAQRESTKGKSLVLDPALAVSMGLTQASYIQLLRLAGFQPHPPKDLPEGVFGPPQPIIWRWRPPRRNRPGQRHSNPTPKGNAFDVLADLVR